MTCRNADTFTVTASADRLEPSRFLELEGVVMGSTLSATTDQLMSNDPVAWVTDRMRDGFQETSIRKGKPIPEYPSCSLNLARYDRIQRRNELSLPVQRKGVIGIAINLHDSAAIIPAQAVAVLEAIAHLLTTNKVYLSIYENGSVDYGRDLLSDFVAAAWDMGVDGIAATSSRLGAARLHDRIVMLSEVRNHVVRPLLPYMAASQDPTLVFINDVVTCASDILEIVHQQRMQRADMAFGMDWVLNEETARLYDLWVGRGLNGGLFYAFNGSQGYHPYAENDDWVRDALITQAADIHQRWLDGRPLPVYSGWGGMAAFDGSMFTKHHLRFRSSVKTGWSLGVVPKGSLGLWGSLVSNDKYLHSDCPGASECEYICRDIWNLREGRARIVLAPQARTAYSVEDWQALLPQIPATRRATHDTQGDLIDWRDVNAPDSVECIPTRDHKRLYIEQWSERNKRYRLAPLWQHDGRYGPS